MVLFTEDSIPPIKGAIIMYKLEVFSRNLASKSNSRLRQEGLIPAVYYHHGESSIPISVSAKELEKMFKAHDSVINLSNGKLAIVKEVNRDAFGSIVHLNFEGVVAGEKFHKKIPLKVFFDEELAGWAKSGRLLRHHLSEVEIEATPEHVPEYIEIDVTHVDADHVVRVKELNVAGYRIISDPDMEIASFGFPHVFKEEPAAPVLVEPEPAKTAPPE